MSVEEEVVAGIEKMVGKLFEERYNKHFKKWNKTMAFSFKEFNKTWFTNLTAGIPDVQLSETEIDKSKDYDIHFITDSKTWLGIVNKEIKAMAAFQSRDLKIKGKMLDLLKLRKVL
ncbi:MAG: SCP2 sterol-binding domain-containing protein [Candidatus Hodarchaeales archaeon]|jgi:putative sterol carrier protein